MTALERRGRRELPVALASDTGATEISWLEPFPGPSAEAEYLARESVELAFVAALQQLSAIQRAALILRDVLGFSAAEAAEQLDTSTVSVNSALQRARGAIESTSPTQQTVLRDLGEEATSAILTRWTDASPAGDVEAIVARLADDARYSMPPLPEWYRGARESARSFSAVHYGPAGGFCPRRRTASRPSCWTTRRRRTHPAVLTSSRSRTDTSLKSLRSSTPISPSSDYRRSSASRHLL